MNKMSQRELIVSIIHSNYNIKMGGTQKYVKELSGVLRKNGYSHLCFFAFPRQKSVLGKDIVGIIYNDSFQGIIESKYITETIRHYLDAHDLSLNCFHIQHLKFHRIADVLAAVLAFKAKVYLFAHDFYLVCKSEHLIDSDGKFCGDGIPSREKCGRCAYCSDALAHRDTICDFIEKTKDRIGHIICPSNYVRRILSATFPSVADRMIVRPHLTLSGERRVSGDVDAVRIAFLGRKRDHKGYDKWRELLKALSDGGKLGAYRFCYLGMDVEEDGDVENVFVSITTQGSDAMKNAVAEHKVNCAFLWPQCPETYSYVYYELLMSGVYIITNEHSGNVQDEVLSRQNGRVFGTLEDCARWLGDPEAVRSEIEQYRNNCTLPEKYAANPDISMMVSDKPWIQPSDGAPRMRTLPVTSLLYRIKYRKYGI